MISQFQKFIHRHGRWVFLILLCVVIVAFIMWDYAGMMQTNRETTFHTVYGKQVNPRELDRQRRLIEIFPERQMGDPFSQHRKTPEQLEQEALARIAMVATAKQLGLVVKEEEVLTRIQQSFLVNGRFDQAQFEQFESEFLARERLTVGDFEGMIRDRLLIQKLVEVLGGTVKIPPAHVRSAAGRLAEQMTAAACRFDSKDVLKQVKPTENEIQRFYSENPEMFRVPPRLRVSYVVFPVQTNAVAVSAEEIQRAYSDNPEIIGADLRTPDGKLKKLIEVEPLLRQRLSREKALRIAADQTSGFALKLYPEPGKQVHSFADLAKQEDREIKETEFFTQGEQPKGITGREFGMAAFQLRKDSPVSDPVVAPDALYVLHLKDERPSEIPPYAGIKEKVKAACMDDTALRVARENGAKKRGEILKRLADGQTWEKAIASIKLKAQTFKDFSQGGARAKDAFEYAVRSAALDLPAGMVSEFVEDETGGFFLYIVSRRPGSPEEISKLEAGVAQELQFMGKIHLFQDFQRVVLDKAIVTTRPVPPAAPP